MFAAGGEDGGESEEVGFGDSGVLEVEEEGYAATAAAEVESGGR